MISPFAKYFWQVIMHNMLQILPSPVAHRYSLDFQSKTSQVQAWGMEKLYWVHQTVQHAESEAIAEFQQVEVTPSPTIMWAG